MREVEVGLRRYFDDAGSSRQGFLSFIMGVCAGYHEEMFGGGESSVPRILKR